MSATSAAVLEERRSLVGKGPRHDAATRAKIHRLKREEGLTNRTLAQRFGLNPTTIEHILRGDWP